MLIPGEFDGMFDPGEYGFRGDYVPRNWHQEAVTSRETSIASRDPDLGQHVFNVMAGTGAGKTILAGMVASNDLNSGRVRRVVYVAPSDAIADRVIEVFRDVFGIHLQRFNARQHRHRVTSDQQGYVVTYQGVSSQPVRHQRIASYEKTLVIFDEVHHLGDGESWGIAAQLAFGAVPYVLTMTGSPFRPNGGVIPFARYEPTDRPDVSRFAADYSYSLGRAIIDGYCREPDFKFSRDVVVQLRPDGRDPFDVRFDQEVSETLAQQRLAIAVEMSSSARDIFLRKALSEIRAAGRKCIVFLGGDTAGRNEADKPTDDAEIHLPDQLERLGYGRDEFVTITHKDGKRVKDKIREFQASDAAWILVTVNLVIEGVDSPELSAAVFLTTWTAPLSVIQRVGRVLRFAGPGKGDVPDAWIYMFHHPEYLKASIEIKQEMEAEAAMKRQRDREPGREGNEPKRRTEGRVLSGGHLTHVVWNGEVLPYEVYERAMNVLTEKHLSKAYLDDIVKEMAHVNGHA